MYFVYGREETDFLARRDRRLGEAIAQIGPIFRETESDVFSSVVHHILGQQISTSAQATLWARLRDRTGPINAERLLALGREGLQGIGTTYKKADYILDFSQSVLQGKVNLDALPSLPDEQVIRELSAVKGVGVWTAEMIMTFCMQRPDIVSFGDLAILRGMRMLYRRRVVDRETFERYRRRYSPYGTVASLYLWAIAGGALPQLTDPAKPKDKPKKIGNGRK